MAAGNAAKALQQNRTRPAVSSRPVMPVVPLSYSQKRKKQQVTPVVKAEEEENVQTPVVPTPAPAPALASADVEAEVEVEVAPPPQKQQVDSTPAASVVNGTSDRLSEKADVDVPAVVEKVEEQPAELPESVEVREPSPEPAIVENKAPSEAPSTGSRSTYQLPPAFVPARQQQFTNDSPTSSLTHDRNSVSIESPAFVNTPQAPFNGHHFHHGHPSTSSLVFGNYSESNTSSPAPLSAGHFPPPPPFAQNGHHPHNSGHAPHMGNGRFPHNGYTPVATPLGPPPGYLRPDGLGQAEYSRRQFGFGGAEGYSPIHTPLPAEVRSFDLPAVPADSESVPTSVNSSGSVPNHLNGIDEVRAYANFKPEYPPPVNYPAHPNGQPPLPMDHLDGLVPYIQSMYQNPEFSDYLIEVRSSNNSERHHIHGHSLILARSPTFKQLMSNDTSPRSRTLVIESDNPYYRGDGFAHAVQRLYGWPLLDVNSHGLLEHPSLPFNQMPEDLRFAIGLSYAISGQILQIPPVINRGLEIACRFINWSTLDKALDFHFDAPTDGQRSFLVQKQAQQVVYNQATSFIITRFPAGFKLDTKVDDNPSKPRLPRVHGHRKSVSIIQFGEIDAPNGTSHEQVNGSAADYFTSVLSRILLGLPFNVLKYILESSRLGNVQGWVTPLARQQLMETIIAEREKRRLDAFSSSVPNQLRNGPEWETVGWQESVLPISETQATPSLGRSAAGITKLPAVYSPGS